ncbi:MAG: hypothetical protein M1381_02740 [Deltaproteobacteria bacterium]|nr:hypothetical protein [Deltaproteobacteria bacterium]MCL5792001.1 hypothetical protein [Deltaproteobacteria bacterium]
MVISFFILYNVLVIIGIIIIAPFLLIKNTSSFKNISERMGGLPAINNCIWVHAASIGEVKASIPILKKLISLGYNVLLTTMTPSGRKYGSSLDIKGLFVSYAPIDSLLFTTIAVKRVKPKAFVILETEIWPNLILSVSVAGVKITGVNSRLTKKASKGYMYMRPIMKFLLTRFTILCVQTNDDKSRFLSLGAEDGTIHVTGNLKYAMTINSDTYIAKDIKKLFYNKRIIIAGSTHRDEEAIVLRCFSLLKQSINNIALIIAPRHLERVSEIEDLIIKEGFGYIKRSILNKPSNGQAEVLLVDTIGELSDIYSIGDVIFIGGSMTPVGGHNLIEAIIHRKPVIYGQHTESVKELVQQLDNKGGIMVHDENELCNAIKGLLEDPDKARLLGNVAYGIINQKVNVVDNIVKIMKTEKII